MVAQIEVPDGVRAVHLIGQDAVGDPQVVLVDTSGRLVAVIYGDDSGTPRALAVDSSGQLIVVPRGQGGNYLDVDASGYLTTVMKGLEGATLRTIAVDASGNIVAVIKGDYGGALKTLATDADGRLLAVPYDPEDIWGNAVGMGNAELAAILSPCKRGDNRGNVLWWDSFLDGLSAWETGTGGTGADVYLSAQRARYGAYSCCLVGGSDGSRYAAISRYSQYPGSTKVGLEAVVAWESDLQEVRLRIVPRDGTNAFVGAVRWVTATEDFEYYDTGAAWQDIDATKPLTAEDFLFHYFKVVIDLATGKYERALLDDEEYDISANSFYSVANANPPRMASEVIVYSDAAANAVTYVDNVILTLNEPAN